MPFKILFYFLTGPKIIFMLYFVLKNTVSVLSNLIGLLCQVSFKTWWKASGSNIFGGTSITSKNDTAGHMNFLLTTIISFIKSKSRKIRSDLLVSDGAGIIFDVKQQKYPSVSVVRP